MKHDSNSNHARKELKLGMQQPVTWWWVTKASKLKRFLNAIRSLLVDLHAALHNFVLFSFANINQKIRAEITLLKMNIETSEHVNSAINVFKWIILPASILYICAYFYLFRENALDSMLLGLLIFFYSNFLPDLPSIYRKKKDENTEDLPWYKKYAILVFAPLLIWVLFSGVRLRWGTTETFHNFKSLAIYGTFLLLLGFFAFGNFPISIGATIKILSLPIYGIIGYLTHLKVDEIW